MTVALLVLVLVLMLQCRERMMTVLEDSSSRREGAGMAGAPQSGNADGRGPAGIAQAAGHIHASSYATTGAAAAAGGGGGQACGRVHRDFR
jgi:hypothetical protein